MFKQERGITLVALVVTIVVLLILAGVSISLVIGQNGIVTKAQEGAHNYQVAANKEKTELIFYPDPVCGSVCRDVWLMPA